LWDYSGDVDRDKPHSLLGAIIREQRELAALPMRQLAKSVGISNPYLSQIERGLRAPSGAVVEALATSLHLSVDELYRRAGFVEPAVSTEAAVQSDLAEAIASAPELTAAQRRAMAEIHRSFIDANRVRRASANHRSDESATE
jgi:transcriptional regulator with XRE-family HTH domain